MISNSFSAILVVDMQVSNVAALRKENGEEFPRKFLKGVISILKAADMDSVPILYKKFEKPSELFDSLELDVSDEALEMVFSPKDAASIFSSNSYNLPSELISILKQLYISSGESIHDRKPILIVGVDTDLGILCAGFDLWNNGVKPMISCKHVASSNKKSNQAALAVAVRAFDGVHEDVSSLVIRPSFDVDTSKLNMEKELVY